MYYYSFGLYKKHKRHQYQFIKASIVSFATVIMTFYHQSFQYRYSLWDFPLFKKSIFPLYYTSLAVVLLLYALAGVFYLTYKDVSLRQFPVMRKRFSPVI